MDYVESRVVTSKVETELKTPLCQLMDDHAPVLSDKGPLEVNI